MYELPELLTAEDRDIWHRVSAGRKRLPNRASWAYCLVENSRHRDMLDYSIMVRANQNGTALDGCWLDAVPMVCDTSLDEEDRTVAGRYWIKFDRSVPARLAATVALDAFHREVPIRCLEDYDFLVTTDFGKPLVEPIEAESYESTTPATVGRWAAR